MADWIRHGQALLDKGQHACAADAFKAALADAGITDDQRSLAQNGLGTSLVGLLKYAEARPILEDALESATRLGHVSRAGHIRISLGLGAFGEGNRDEADRQWTQAVEAFKRLGEPKDELRALALLVVIRKTLADRPLHERLLVLAQEVGDPDDVPMAHLQWADALIEAGLGGAAIRELEHAAALLHAQGADLPNRAPYRPSEDTLARVETSLGLALRQHGASERALTHYEAAIDIERRVGNLEGLYQCTNGLATAYAELGRWGEARTHYALALAIAQQLGLPRLVDDALSSEGWVALARHRPTAALPIIQQAVAGPLDHWTAPYTYTNLATAFRQLKRPQEAVAPVERALVLAREREMVNAEAQALLERAQIFDALERHDDALSDAREVLAIIERARAKLSPVDFLRRGFGDIHEHAYDVVVSLLQRRGRTEEALAAAEQSRARAFADLLAARALGRSTGEEQIPLLGEAPANAGDAPAVRAVTSDLSASAAANALTPADLAALAARLHSVIIEYWVGDAGSVAWVVTSNGRVHARVLPVTPSRLSARVDETAADPLTGHAAGSNPYRTLYTQLVAPIARWLPPGGRLTIIPHGSLFRLSFAALLDDRGTYLVERYAIHYAPGGAVLRLAERRTSEASSRQGRYLLVADPSPLPVLPDERPLPELPGARAEVASIAQTVGPARCTVFTGDAAEEGLVAAQLPRASVIHLATHAIVGDRDTLSSFIALGRRTGDAREPLHDGRLTASEVYDVPLSADLVVLSACRSARGRVSSDGIAGLTRAFISAGAPTVVAALWDVADVLPARLMPRFYEQYARGVAKDEALRRAQLAVLSDLRRGRLTTPGPNGPVKLPDDPAYWAGFVVVGTP